MLDFIYYPVSFILWCWHKVFGFVLGENNALAWVLAIMFLTFTVRGIMFKPFVSQVRSMRKMQDFAPEMKKLQKKYANDRQRQAQEMQKLQREHGVNPLGSCLPMLLQIPVFIGLNWVLRAFTYNPNPGTPKTENYFFEADGVQSYLNAKLFGVNIGEAIHNTTLVGGQNTGWHWEVAPVAIPLMIVASAATFLTARHNAARQNPAAATAQTAMMNKLTQYVFPLGVLVFGAFFPIGLLIYWLSNNGWTLMQQRYVYKKIDREQEEKKAADLEKRNALAPKPGQRPAESKKPQVGQKPVQNKNKSVTKAGSPHGFAQQGSGKNGQSAKNPAKAKGTDAASTGAAPAKNADPAKDTNGAPAATSKSTNGTTVGVTKAGDSTTQAGNGAARSPGKKSGRKRR